MSHSMQTSRKGSPSFYEDMTSRTSSGFAEDFNFRPDTAPGISREQTLGLPISPLVIGERSKSVPLNMRMPGRPGQEAKLSAREILQSAKTDDRESVKSRPKTVLPKVEETLQKGQPWYMDVLQDKEARILEMGNEINRLSGLETDMKQKENEIFDLRRQLAQNVATETAQDAEKVSLIAKLKNRENTLSAELVRLYPLEQEMKSRDETIADLQKKLEMAEEGLRQQSENTVQKPAVPSYVEVVSTIMSEADRSQVMSHKVVVNGNSYDEQVRSLHETLENVNADADALKEKFDVLVPEKLTPEDEVMLMKDEIVKKTQIIATLEEKLSETQKELTMNEGFVNALQRDLQGGENKILKLISQVEKAESKMNEAIAESQAMSKKFSDLRESRKHNDMAAENEHELTLMRAAFSEAQTKIEKMKEKMDKQSKEIRDSHRKLKKGGEQDRKQSEEIKHLCRDLEDMRRQEQLSRVSAEQISARFERLRSRVIQAVYITPGAALPESVVSDVVVFNAVKKIIDDRSEFHKKLEETNPDFPPLLIELDSTQDEEKVDEAPPTTAPNTERKSGKGGRKSPKHR